MRKAALGMFVLLFLIAVIVLALAMTPADIIVKKSDLAVVQMAQLNGTQPGNYLSDGGFTTADFNNDGHLDMVVAGPSKNLSGGAADSTGQVYVFYGSPNGLHSYSVAQANVTFNGTSPGNFGYCHASGDFNNNTYVDLVVGAYLKNLSGGAYDSTGQVYVFYGSSDGLHSYTAAETNVTFNGTSLSSQFGTAIVASDFNRDNLTDLAISANGQSLNGTANVGQVYIFYGSFDGFHSYTSDQANITINGTSPSYLGLNLLADDFNNDNTPDILATAIYKNLSGGATDYTGQVYIFYGSQDGLHSYTTTKANVTFNGTSPGRFGYGVTYADFNGDSLKDLAIAAPDKNLTEGPLDTTTGNNFGQVYIFFGTADGFHSYTSLQANVSINGTSGGRLGRNTIDTADINRDNITDIIIGASRKNISEGAYDLTGQAYIFYGSQNWRRSYTTLEANITINGTLGSGFGVNIKAVDLAGDNVTEILIGALYLNVSGGVADSTGAVYVYTFNFPPTSSTIPSQSWNEDSSITINLSHYFTDVNRDNPNYTWTSPADITISIDESTNIVTLTPNANWYGTEYIMFYANDSYNDLVASNNITLTVSNTADCGDNTCDSSESCTLCASDCGACPAVPGGSIAAAPTAAFTVGILPAGTPTEFNLGEKTAVSMITVTSNTNLNNVRIEAKEVQESSVKEPLETAYKYLEISTRNINYDDIKTSKITFKVDKKWVEEKGIEKSQIILMRYSNGWQKLETSYFGTSNGDYAYRAISPGFSTFAIASLPKEDVEESKEEEEKKPIVEEVKEEPTQKIEEQKKSRGIYCLLIALIVAILIAFLLKSKRRKGYK